MTGHQNQNYIYLCELAGVVWCPKSASNLVIKSTAAAVEVLLMNTSNAYEVLRNKLLLIISAE